MEGFLLYNVIMDDVDNFIEQNKDLFDNLSKQEELDRLALSHREREIAYHILLNESEIQRDILQGHNPHYHLLPSSLPEIYLDQYAERALGIIKKHLESFHLSPEESAGLKEFMKTTVGLKLLEPPNVYKLQ